MSFKFPPTPQPQMSFEPCASHVVVGQGFIDAFFFSFVTRGLDLCVCVLTYTGSCR